MSLDKAITGAMAPLKRALWRTVRRGIVKLADAAAMLQIEGYEGERTSDVEYWQHYGLASRPPAGAEALTLQVGGDTEQPITIATHDAAGRPDDLEGEEVALYSGECIVWLRENGDIDIMPYRTSPAAGVVHLCGDSSNCNEPVIRGTEFLDDLLTAMNGISGGLYGPGQAAGQAAIATFVSLASRWKSNYAFVEERPSV